METHSEISRRDVSQPEEPVRKVSIASAKITTRARRSNCKSVKQRKGQPSSAEDDGKSDSADDVEYIEDFKLVKISDADAFTCFYDTKFRQIGQLSLKKILKCWIKKIHPKKQANYPYNGGKFKERSRELHGEDNPGEETKPPYWPPTLWCEFWERCRHKEPDHQRKLGQGQEHSAFL